MCSLLYKIQKKRIWQYITLSQRSLKADGKIIYMMNKAKLLKVAVIVNKALKHVIQIKMKILSKLFWG